MKKKLLMLKKTVLASLIVLFVSTGIQAATFTAVQSGDWSSSSTWGTTAPSFSVSSDQITIPSGISVTMDNNVTINGALAELKVNGNLNGSTSTTLAIAAGTLSGAGNITTGTVAFGAGAVFTFTGTITTNNLVTATLDLKTSATIIVKETLTLTSGVLSIQSGGSLTVNSGATVIVSGGQIVTNGGTLTLSSGYNVSYMSTGATAGLELNGGTVHDLTINIPSGQKITLASDLTVTGTLTLTSGVLNLSTSNLTLTGDVAASGNGTITSTLASSITINTSNSLSGSLNFTGTNAVNNLTVNVGSGNHAQINGDLTVNGTLTLTSGTLIVSQSTFTIQGNIASAGSGTLSTSSNDNLVISTSTSPSGSITFASGSNSLNNLTINILDGGTVKVSSGLTVNGTLNFMKGHIDMGSNNLTIGSSGSITGASSSSYVITSMYGSLSMTLTSGTSTAVTYPVGTVAYYLPVAVMLNTGSTSGTVSVGAFPHVYGHGTTGTLISATQHAVDATWDIQTSFTNNLNMNIELMWPASAEVNGFDRSKAYISHFINGNWDMMAATNAIAEANGMYGLKKSNITSLSPFAVFDQSTQSAIEYPATENTTAFSIYPNPVGDNLMINTATLPQNCVLQVCGIDGKLIGTYRISQLTSTIPVTNLKSGCYFIKLSDEKSETVLKFIKM
jgi:hypothetical protein